MGDPHNNDYSILDPYWGCAIAFLEFLKVGEGLGI